MVSDLSKNEATTVQKSKQESSTKNEDSGHDSEQSSLNAGAYNQHLF